MSSSENDLDPRIQIELENLNTATDEINKLEIELEEANSTFRILLNESTRRLKVLSKKLGNCIEKARPYYDALEKAREAQIECQKAAVQFQRANEIHTAAKETVALAEQRFMSNSHEWQFDNAWQEMLNHATQKVMDAEKQKAESHTEHQCRALIFNAAEKKVQQLEERFRRSIMKSRPYFEEKQICQDQLQTQKNRIQELQAQVQAAKSTYSTALRNLERISDDIHRQRGDFAEMSAPPPGPREPGVGAELNTPPFLPDFNFELDKCEHVSRDGSEMSFSATTTKTKTASCHVCNEFENDSIALTTIVGAENATKNINDNDDDDNEDDDDEDDYDPVSVNNDNGDISEQDLEKLRQKMKTLSVRPVEGGDGQQQQDSVWENELKATVDKLDQLMMMKECANWQQKHQQYKQNTHRTTTNSSSTTTLVGTEYAVTAAANRHNKASPMITAATATIAAASNYSLMKIATKLKATTLTPPLPLPPPPHEQQLITSSIPATPEKQPIAIKKLQKLDPLPSVNVSMRELPLLARLSNEILDRATGYTKQRRRSLD